MEKTKQISPTEKNMRKEISRLVRKLNIVQIGGKMAGEFYTPNKLDNIPKSKLRDIYTGLVDIGLYESRGAA